MAIWSEWFDARGVVTHRAIHTGSITNPTKKSARANELEMVLRARNL